MPAAAESLEDFRLVVSTNKGELEKVRKSLALLRERGVKGGQRLSWLIREEARLTRYVPHLEELLRLSEERLKSESENS